MALLNWVNNRVWHSIITQFGLAFRLLALLSMNALLSLVLLLLASGDDSYANVALLLKKST